MLRRSAVAAALTLVFPALGAAQGLVIDHQAVGCLVAETFPRFDAGVEPMEDVARARIYFRGEGGPHWYFIEMKPEAGLYRGVLPKPKKSLKRINYYIEVVDRSFAESRTAEYAPDVAPDAGACSKKTTAASVVPAGPVVLGVPVGAPAVPFGFNGAGLVAAGSAAGTAAGAASGTGTAVGTAAGTAAGGISTTAVVVGAGAAVGAGAIAATSGGSSPSTQRPTTTTPAATTSTTTTPPAPSPPPATRPSPPPPSTTMPRSGAFAAVAGQWGGTVQQVGISYHVDVNIDGRAPLGSKTATAIYSAGLNCTSYWIGESVKGDDYAASEIIANGKGRCINDDVRFTYSASPRRLDLGYFVNGQQIGTAILFPE